MKISGRISIALTMIAVIALIASGVAILFLNEFHRNYQTVSRQKVPAVIAAAQLIRLTQRLIANAPAIVMAENQIIREDVMRDVEQDEKLKDGLLNDLGMFGADRNRVDKISRSFDLLIDNLKRLNRISSKLIVVKIEIQRVILRLLQLSDVPSAGMNAAPEMILRLNRQINMLLNLQFEPNSDRLQKLEKKFENLHATSEIHDLPSELIDMKREIEYFGRGDRNLFRSRSQKIRLETEIQENLNQNRFISTKLGNEVNRLFEAVSTEITQQRDRFDLQTRQLAITVFFIPFLTLIGTLVIIWHIRRSIIRRILDLEECMHSHIRNQPKPVEISGNDEITSMAEAVAYFIDNRTEYERSLKQTRNAAEAANRAKSDFLANMSHELRTPLNAVIGFSRILAHGDNLSKEQQEHLRIINRSGEHLLTLINSVLDMSKIEAGRTILCETNFDLLLFLDDLKDMFRIRAQKKFLYLRFDRTPDVPSHITTDEAKLRQVLINLVGNALKFTEKGGVAVKVTAEEKNVLRFAVEDTGPGIIEDELKNVFEPFVQTQAGRKSQEGTGLGLSISRKFVQLMGGGINVRSELNRGTVFEFSIRAGTPEERKPDIFEESGLSEFGRVIGIEPGQPCFRILIVDDNSDNRLVLKTLLELPGLELREAENGRYAVDIWHEWNPHLIWMDIRMPVINGYQAAEKIRKYEVKDEGPVIIAISASSLENEYDIAVSKGCNDFLRKPFKENEIYESMRRHLGVRFIYETVADAGEPKPEDDVEYSVFQIQEAIDALPEQLRADFLFHSEIGDSDKAMHLTEQIREQDPLLADELVKLVEDFQFGVLTELFSNKEESVTTNP